MFIFPNVVKYRRTGSSYTCNPPVQNTDIDFLVLIEEKEPGDFSQYLINQGYLPDGAEGKYVGKGDFTSWRKDNINLIVTSNKDFYLRFDLATRVAKSLNILEKENRIKMFEFIMNFKE